ncbi:MAG: hypothetical protein Ct9H300mP26_5140 [Acidimicrobiales bacterium]|nr:MAG: hypothetical protein Ct9H300mP26_5140 [Acidimicrobiales bacterium]
MGIIGGSRLTNEDAYAWSKMARSVIGTDNIDAQLDDGLPAELVLGLPPATIADACEADTVLIGGPRSQRGTCDIASAPPRRCHQRPNQSGPNRTDGHGSESYAQHSILCQAGEAAKTLTDLLKQWRPAGAATA